MSKSNRKASKLIEESDSDDSDNEPLAKQRKKLVNRKTTKISKDNSSSSESDIENYLTHPDELDLKSTFFQPYKPQDDGFAEIENNIFKGVKQLSDSGSESDDEDIQKEEVKQEMMNFEQLSEYTKQIELAKEMVKKYNEKKKEEKNLDIQNLLAAGEKNLLTENDGTIGSFHSSDFESASESDKGEWEEVGEKKEATKSEPRKDGIEITVEMPDVIRKKKGVDLVAAMKRRLNRIKKENQVFVHKVHLLTWIAHGNFVNSVLNKETVLGMALSLLPSQSAYPSGRVDMKYLEQILKWYQKAIVIKEKPAPKKMSLDKSLLVQITKREAYNKNVYVYIFVCILRALGIQCRLVLSLQVEPLRPPASELCSLSSKDAEKNKKGGTSKNEDKTKISKKENNDGTKSSKKENIAKSKEAEIKKSKPKKVDDIKKVEKSEEINSVNKTKTQRSESEIETKQSKNLAVKEKPVQKRRSKSNPNNEDTGSSPPKQMKLEIKAESSSKEKISTEEEKSTRTIRKSTKSESFSKATTSKSSNKKHKNIIEKNIDALVNSLEKSDEVKVNNKKIPYVKIETTTKSSRQSKKSKESEKKSSSDENFLGFTPEKKSSSEENFRGFTPEKKSSSEENFLGFTPEKKSSSEENFLGFTPEKKVGGKSEDEPFLGFSPPKKIKTERKINLRKLGIKNTPNKSDEEQEFLGFSPQKETKMLDKRKLNLAKLKNATKKVPQMDGIDDSSSEDEVPIIDQLDGSSDDKKEASTSRKPNLKNLKRPARECKTKTHEPRLKIKPIESNSEDEFQKSTTKSPLKKSTSKGESSRFFNKTDVRKDVINIVKSSMREQKYKEKSRKRVKKDDSDSDYADEAIEKKHDSDFVEKVKVKKRVLPKSKLIDRRVFSSDEEPDNKTKKKKGLDIWIEVFLEDEEKWICADVVSAKVHCIKDLQSKATQPVSYILSWDNTSRIKDVTNRYCPNWNTVTRKLRVDPKWWEESLKPFKGKQTIRDKEEDEDLARQQFEQPLPTTISEYKNHPLYVLQRHLLKFEAIYPTDTLTVGFIRKEPVYPRNSVYTLHSREMWFKEAKVVKPGEKAYKIVKARPKYDKLSNTMITDKPLDIFGIWQTMDYDPPAAENGVIPRNAYGNVELFKPCMIPKNTVHLQLPGLNKVARKLNVDCAPAVVGFDFHSGWNHPTYDGYIVCKEHEDILVAAWYEEQEEAEKREQEKYEKRVYGNWRKIIKAVFIREKLKIKYDFRGENSKASEASTSSQSSKEEAPKPKKKGPRFTITKKK